MRFYILTWPGRYDEIQPDAAGVIRSQLLPGFQFRRADLLDLPDLDDLALDEIYADYVIPAYAETAAQLEAEAAARRQAEERTQQAEQQAAAEAAARRQVEEDNQALQAEIARLRRHSS